MKKADKKVTLHIPADLLKKAQQQTGQGITATIRHGLKLVAAGEAYKRFRELRGKVSIRIDLEALRNDGR